MTLSVQIVNMIKHLDTMTMLTRWNLGDVVEVLYRGREVQWIDRQPYGVDSHGFTGGPVLRGPWGSFVGLQGEYSRYETECKRLIAAHLHGLLVGRRSACERAKECNIIDNKYCDWCGGHVE
jgi:hypothetical protein